MWIAIKDGENKNDKGGSFSSACVGDNGMISYVSWVLDP
jgi:hypothetical protein